MELSIINSNLCFTTICDTVHLTSFKLFFHRIKHASESNYDTFVTMGRHGTPTVGEVNVRLSTENSLY